MRSLVVSILAFAFSLSTAQAADPTEAQVKKLVNDTAEAIKKDAAGTFAKINAGEAPFKDPQNPGFYVFAYDLDLKMMGHPDKTMVGRDLRNKPDACGCLFRDEVLNRVKGTTTPTRCKDSGDKEWVTYIYKNPEKKALEKKKTYFKSAKGNDGKEYVVLSGLYVAPMAGCEK